MYVGVARHNSYGNSIRIFADKGLPTLGPYPMAEVHRPPGYNPFQKEPLTDSQKLEAEKEEEEKARLEEEEEQKEIAEAKAKYQERQAL
jgi:hypothetical protein